MEDNITPETLKKKVRAPAEMAKDFTARFRIQNPILRTIVGVGLILVGLLALVTPITPGAWLALVGLEVLGIHVTFTQRILAWLHKRGIIR